jgi:hypothetical protein
MADHIMDIDEFSAELKSVHDDLMAACLIVERQETEEADETLRRIVDAVAGMMKVYALVLDDAPPWAPEDLKPNFQQWLLDRRRSTN